jgi:hypothetical protein
MVSGPTRTCPCSMNLTACTRVSGGLPREVWRTYCADRLCHLGHAHDDGKAASTKGGDSELIVDIAELGGGGEDTHVVQLGEELALHFRAKRILGREERDTVGILAEGATEFVISGQHVRVVE